MSSETAAKSNFITRFIARMDEKVEGRPGLLTVWQVVKFSLISIVVALIQTVLQYVLPLIFDNVTAVLPSWLAWIFNTDSLFDVTTAAGAKDFAKYVVNGVITWGYVLPFFLSNYIANIYSYIQNKKTTFKSDAPRWHFVLYFIILTLLIVFSTWLQGFTYGWVNHIDSSFIHAISRLIVMAPAGMLQFIVLFIAQKILLPMREEDKHPSAAAAADGSEAVIADIGEAVKTVRTKVPAEQILSAPKGRKPIDGNALHTTLEDRIREKLGGQ